MKFRDIVVVSVAVAVIFICIVVIVLAVIFSKSKYKIKYFLWTVFIEIYYKVSDDIPFIFFKQDAKREHLQLRTQKKWTLWLRALMTIVKVFQDKACYPINCPFNFYSHIFISNMLIYSLIFVEIFKILEW